MAADPTNLELEQLRQLSKKKAWRALIEFGERSLAQPTDDQSIRLHAELGKAYLQVKQYPAARRILEAAHQLQPKNSLVRRRLGELESAVGNYEAAVEYWQALKKKKGDRTDTSIYLHLAKALRNLGRLEAAERIASEGHANFPKNPQLRREFQRVTAMLNDQPLTFSKNAGTPDLGRRHPYHQLDSKSYWNKTVSPVNALEIDSWYKRKFSINGLSISSAGSCFAQHIGRALRQNGYEYIDVEPAPDFLRPESHHDFGYGIYSARFGNIYTSRQLLQLLKQSLGLFDPRHAVWEKDGGYVDAFRPTIEPEPFKQVDEVLESRASHLAAVKRMFRLSNVFIYTMGLTETWASHDDGAVYPVAPGVSGGSFDPSRYVFKNLTYPEILADMEDFIELVRNLNSTLKIVLTVSPVPLMATASSNNVVVASSYSKSVLRSVAGYLSDKYDFVDYFPSYEIIGSHIMRGQFFNPDGRTVSLYGVSHVMKQFFAEHVPPQIQDNDSRIPDPDDVVCDEELLREFGPS